MNITIIGAGGMAKAISARLLTNDHSVSIRDKNETKAKALADKLNRNPKIKGGATSTSYNDEITDEIIFLAIPYAAADEVIKMHKRYLNHKIVVDITNPINETYNGLIPPAESSAAQEIQKMVPKSTQVVKAFNTNFAGTLLYGQVAGEQLDVLVAGDDQLAKNKIMDLARSVGLNSIDAGPLVNARYLEAAGFLHILLQPGLGSKFMSALKFVH